MNRNGPIIVIEDDEDDKFMLEEIFSKLNYSNKIYFFSDSEEALDYLNRTEVLPFLILSDIYMPKLNGFELRQKLKSEAALPLKCIPYIFFTTRVEQQAVIDAFSMSVQGFFIKPNSVKEIENSISSIIEYWKRCAPPIIFSTK